MTSCNIVTPHAPIVVLLSHLQALYNNNVVILTFIIVISLFLGHYRRCGRHCNSIAPIGGRQRRRKS